MLTRPGMLLRALLILASVTGLSTSALAEPARLETRGQAVQLIVDGQPFLILGGELGNSSASHREYLAPAWARMQAMHLNTVLAPVSWELIEPEEGRFDFSTLDGLLADARAHDMRLVLLWFGTWKNSMSTYVPSWVKRDSKRFSRTLGADDAPQEILSALDRDTMQADARAFAAMMRHLKAVDGERGTVIMVQVENEVGFLPRAREGAASDDLAADEREMAKAYARFVDAVAAAGKAEYDLPMFANGAQGRPGVLPGSYPSGGPLAHLAEIWRKNAPHVDFIAPDIYFPNFAAITDGYVASGNPLFIPEANNAGDARAGANALRAIGMNRAMGFSPFSIDGISEDGAARLGSLYAMLAQIAPQVLAAQGTGQIAGFSNTVSFGDSPDLRPISATLGPVTLTATTIDPWTAREKQDPSTHGAVAIWLGGEDYLIGGQGVTFTLAPADNQGLIGLDVVEEGRFVDGRWLASRRLNGDQTHQGRHLRLPPGDYTLQRVRIYRY